MRCMRSGKMVPTPAGQPQRVKIERKIWMRLEIHNEPKAMKTKELGQLAKVLGKVLAIVQKEIDSRLAAEEKGDAEKTENVPAAAALDDPEEKKERSGPVLFDKGVADDQESSSST